MTAVKPKDCSHCRKGNHATCSGWARHVREGVDIELVRCACNEREHRPALGEKR